MTTKNIAEVDASDEEPIKTISAPQAEIPHQTTQWKPQKQQWLIFGCLALLSFVISLDTTIITPAIPVRIARDRRQTHGNLPQTLYLGPRDFLRR